MASAVPAMSHAHDDGEEDSHEEIFQEARFEQREFFRQMQEDILNGIPVDVASGQCKYISSIFAPPPLKTVALTFDDGPSSSQTPRVLDILKKYGIKGTFFMKGDNARANPAVVKRIKAEGHIVASHSYSHPNFHTLSQGQQASEINTTDSIIGAQMPVGFKLFRYPYGNSTCSSNSLLKNTLGYRGIVGWHVDSCDWAYSKNGYVSKQSADICEVSASNMANYVGHVVAEVNRHRGGIVLMHDIHKRTVDNLEEVILRLQRDGFKFSNLDDPRFSNSIN